jgi:galactonate dehydratase
MKITAIETIRLDEFPNLLWVHVETDEGLTGLGEIFYGAGAAEAHIHEFIAPYLLGQNPLLIDRHAKALVPYVGYTGSGAEMRGFSGVDIALWDIWGQATNQPIHQKSASTTPAPAISMCAPSQTRARTISASTARKARTRICNGS